MIARIQIRRDKESNWAANNPILTLGEIGYDEDTEKFKVGISNSSRWNDLPYELGQWKTDESGNISYGYATDGPAEGNVSIKNDLFVGGDLTVKGTTTTINTEVATFKDDIIQLNLDVDDTGIYSGTLQSGFEVNRGNVPSIGLSSQKIYWDEADGPSGRWVIDTDLNVLGDIYSNGTALWRLNGNDIYFDNGYVAIGLDNPSSVLHIKDVAPIITLEDENNPAHIWQVGQNADKFFINTETAADGSMFSILDDGKVGIGTTTPDTILEVVGADPILTIRDTDTSVTTVNAKLRLAETNASDTLGNHWDIEYLASDLNFSYNGNPFMHIDYLGKVGIGTTNPSAKLDITENGGGTQFRVGGTSSTGGQFQINNAGSDIYALFRATGSNDNKILLHSNGDSYFMGGQVGIGTSGPSSKLHLNGSSGVFAKITDTASSGTIETGLVLERSGANTDYRVLNNGTFRVQTATDASTWTDIMTITSAGNVDFLGDVTSNGAQVGVWTPNGNDIYYPSGDVGIGTSTDTNYPNLTNVNRALTIYADENGGSNVAALELSGDVVSAPDQIIGQISFHNQISNVGSKRVAQIAAATNTPHDSRAGNLDFYTAHTNANLLRRMRIDSQGNVGIGTSSPGAILDVSVPSNGTIGTLYTTTREYNDSTNRVDLLFKYKFNSDGDYTNGSQISLTKESTVDGHYGSDIRFWTRKDGVASSEKMRIQGDGNVGIGVTGPGSVSGNNPNNTQYIIPGNNTHTYFHLRNDGGGVQSIIDGDFPTILFHFDDNSLIQNRSVYRMGRLSTDTTGVFSITNNNNQGISLNEYGKVGINNTNPSELLDVDGNITATGNITSASDITLKENIELILDPIEKVKELSGYTFNKKGEDLRMVGLIAQEVEKVLPEAVHENQEGLKSLAYGNLVALLVECVKKQDERIESLERTIKEMK